MTRRSGRSRVSSCARGRMQPRETGARLRHAGRTPSPPFAVVDGPGTPHVEMVPLHALVCVTGGNSKSPSQLRVRNWAAPRLVASAQTAATSASGRSGNVTSAFDTPGPCRPRANAQACSKAPGSRGWSSSSYFVASAAGGDADTVSTRPSASKIASRSPPRRACSGETVPPTPGPAR